MKMLRTIALSFVLVAGIQACGDDDKPTDTRDSQSDTETTPDTSADTTPDMSPDTMPDTMPDVMPDTTPDTTPDTDTVQPTGTFPAFVIDLVRNQTSITDPVPYSSFSTLADDQSAGVFNAVTF